MHVECLCLRSVIRGLAGIGTRWTGSTWLQVISSLWWQSAVSLHSLQVACCCHRTEDPVWKRFISLLLSCGIYLRNIKTYLYLYFLTFLSIVMALVFEIFHHWKRWTCLSCIINAVFTDDLAPDVPRSSVAMILIYIINRPLLYTREGFNDLINLCYFSRKMVEYVNRYLCFPKLD